jgi:TetR/AcrR family transcriptional regulator, fatty acid metabolism regulator protein
VVEENIPGHLLNYTHKKHTGIKPMSIASHSLKEKQRLEREALILQAAEEMLEQNGYHETSMDEIAARVGIAKGTLYIHFPSKEALAIALLERTMQKFLAGIDTVIEQHSTSRARLEALLRYIMTDLLQKQVHLFSSLSHSLDLKCQEPEREARLGGLWQRLAERIVTLIEEGQATGEFKSALSKQAMLYAFFSIFTTRHLKKHIVNDEHTSQKFVDQLIEIYFMGIAVEPRS